jgi:signal transduction histidine kinase
MEDLSLHILDIVENSLRAGARNVAIRITEEKNRSLQLEIEDDGAGMDEQTIINALNPFFTSKRGKKFGLGLPLLSQSAEETGGHLSIEHRNGTGIKVTALFFIDNIDMKPLGNISSTMRVLKASHPDVSFSFNHIIKNGD